jgi:hypothetical protein
VRQEADPTGPLHERIRTFCKRAPVLLDYYAAIPSTIAPETCFANKSLNSPVFTTGWSLMPLRKTSATPADTAHNAGLQSEGPANRQANEHRRAKTNPWAVIGS